MQIDWMDEHSKFPSEGHNANWIGFYDLNFDSLNTLFQALISKVMVQLVVYYHGNITVIPLYPNMYSYFGYKSNSVFMLYYIS